jgi:hypothetical protein
MPHHIHTSPQCGFWTGHDPSCTAQNLGPETDCLLIEQGKNKGKYLCIHRRPPERGSGHDIFGAVVQAVAGTGVTIVKAPGFKPGEEEKFQRLLPSYFMNASEDGSTVMPEYDLIRALLHEPDPPMHLGTHLSDTPKPALLWRFRRGVEGL